MPLEVLSTAAAIGAFVVIAATAIAAVVQLRHLQAQNQLTGLLTVLARVEDPQFNEWVDGAREMLRARLPDETYRRAVVDGSYERKNNPWLNLANSYDWVGSLVKHKLIPEEALLDVYAGRVDQAWSIVEGIVSIMYAIEHRNQLPGRWIWMLVSGIVDLILAGIIFAGLAGTAVWALGLLVGINLVFGGAALIAMALAARQPA